MKKLMFIVSFAIIASSCVTTQKVDIRSCGQEPTYQGDVCNAAEILKTTGDVQEYYNCVQEVTFNRAHYVRKLKIFYACVVDKIQ